MFWIQQYLHTTHLHKSRKATDTLFHTSSAGIQTRWKGTQFPWLPCARFLLISRRAKMRFTKKTKPSMRLWLSWRPSWSCTLKCAVADQVQAKPRKHKITKQKQNKRNMLVVSTANAIEEIRKYCEFDVIVSCIKNRDLPYRIRGAFLELLNAM